MPLKSLADLRAVEPPPWIWRGFLTPGGITLISAAPKTGKTTLIAHLIRAIWTEFTFLGQAIHPSPVLVVSEEADTLIADRAGLLEYSEMWPISWLTPEPGRTWDQTLEYVKLYAKLYANPVIIIDTLSRHWGIEDENDNAQVERALNPVIAIARKTGASFLLVHHTRKSGGTGGLASRGGSAIVGACDIIVELTRYARDDRSNRRRVECYSRYSETPENMVIVLEGGEYVLDRSEEDAGEGAAHSESPARRWLLNNPGWWTVAAIASASGIPERTVRDALAQSTVSGDVDVRGTGRRNDPYLYGIDPDYLGEEDQ